MLFPAPENKCFRNYYLLDLYKRIVLSKVFEKSCTGRSSSWKCYYQIIFCWDKDLFFLSFNYFLSPLLKMTSGIKLYLNLYLYLSLIVSRQINLWYERCGQYVSRESNCHCNLEKAISHVKIKRCENIFLSVSLWRIGGTSKC